jgi:DUF3043 family protein
VFRRHSAASADEPARSDIDITGISSRNGAAQRDSRAQTAAKGRPTPKRSEAAPRRQPVAAPGNRKEAVRQGRERQRLERARRAEGIRRGDERYMPVKDRGPVRGLARDYVDSRRMLSEYYLYVVAILMVMLLVPLPRSVKAAAYPLVLATILTVSLEGFITGRRVRKIAAVRFPGESTRGLAFYAFVRSAQIRKFRLPKPRVKRGAQI